MEIERRRVERKAAAGQAVLGYLLEDNEPPAEEELGPSVGEDTTAANLSWTAPSSDTFNGNSMRVRCECLEVIRVGGQHGASRLGDGYHQRVHCRTSASTATEKGCPSRESLADVLDKVAGLEEPILGGIASGMPLQALDKHDRRNERRPQVFRAERKD